MAFFSDFHKFSPNALVLETGGPGATLCNGDSAQLFAYGGLTYKWSPSDFLSDTTTNSPIARHLTNSIKYKVVIGGPCNLKDSSEIQLMVAPYLEANYSVDVISGKAPLTVTFTNNSVNAAKSFWDFNSDGDFNDQGEGLNNSTTFSHVFNNTTNDTISYNITLSVSDLNNVCTKTITKTVLVYPSSSISATITDSKHCNPLSVAFNCTSSSGVAYLWDFGDGGSSNEKNPTHIFNNLNSIASTNKVILKILDQYNNLISKDSTTVTVQPFIKASFNVDKTEGCSPLAVAIQNDSRGGIAQWYWDRNGDGVDDYTGEGSGTSVYANPTTTNTPISVTISLRVTNAGGCSDTIARIITVNPLPVINTFTTDNHGNAHNCSPLNIDFTATTTNSTIYHWLLDGNAIDNNLVTSYTFENFGSSASTKVITFSASNQYGCSTTQSSNISVQPYVDAQFTADKESGCSPLSVNFVNASSVGSSLFQWYVDGVLYASTNNIPSQIFTNPTVTNSVRTIPVKLVARNAAGCSDDVTKNITINPQSTASFTFNDNGNTNHCSPLNAAFISTVTNTETYQWDFGTYGSSTSANPLFNFNNEGTSDITIPITLLTNNSFGCSTSKTQNIIVRPKVKALFSMDKISGCPPYDVIASATTSAAITNYTWDFDGTVYTGSSQVFTNPSNLTGNDITKNIKLTVSSGFCSDQTTKSIIVYPQVEAKYSALPLLIGCSPITVNFQNQSALYGTGMAVNTIIWDFNDNTSSTSTNVNHTFTNIDNTIPKTYNVQLTAISDQGCTDEKTIAITVNPKVNAAFNAQIDSACTPVKIHVTDASFAGSTISTYNWNFDGGTPTTPLNNSDFYVRYTNPDPENAVSGTIALNLSNTFGCTSSTSQTFTIDPTVISAIAIASPLDQSNNPLNSACPNTTFTFKNLSSGSNSYTWDFDDGTTRFKNDRNDIEHKFINSTANSIVFNVSLTAQNNAGCTSKSSTNITINPNPQIELGDDKSICEGDSVILDAGNSGSTYLWSNNETYQVITIFESGIYSVVVTSPENCTNSDEVSITVNPNPQLNLGDDIKVSLPYTINSNINNVIYHWSTGETTKSIVVNSYGTYSLTVTNSDGCSASDEITIMTLDGINADGSNATVLVYPNPASDIINVQIESKKANRYIVELIDPLSRVIQSKTLENVQSFKIKFEAEHLVPGMYFVRINTSKGSKTIKVIVK